jgi:hypothetical protein
LEKPGHVVGVGLVRRCHADADRHLQGVGVVQAERLLRLGFDEALRRTQPARAIETPEQHRKLVTPDAKPAVAAAHASPEALGGPADGAVTRGVAERVIDHLEVIDVDEQ